MVDSIGTLLHALCEIVSSNDYLAVLVPDVARRGWNYRAKKKRERRVKKPKEGEREVRKKERTRGGRRDRGAGALFLWEDPMHNLDSRAQV